MEALCCLLWTNLHFLLWLGTASFWIPNICPQVGHKGRCQRPGQRFCVQKANLIDEWNKILFMKIFITHCHHYISRNGVCYSKHWRNLNIFRLFTVFISNPSQTGIKSTKSALQLFWKPSLRGWKEEYHLSSAHGTLSTDKYLWALKVPASTYDHSKYLEVPLRFVCNTHLVVSQSTWK